jgi:hypothetical protein
MSSCQTADGNQMVRFLNFSLVAEKFFPHLLESRAKLSGMSKCEEL